MHLRSFRKNRLKLTPRKIHGPMRVYARSCPYNFCFFLFFQFRNIFVLRSDFVPPVPFRDCSRASALVLFFERHPPPERPPGAEPRQAARAESSRLHRQQHESPPRATESPRSVGSLQEQAPEPQSRHAAREESKSEPNGSRGARKWRRRARWRRTSGWSSGQRQGKRRRRRPRRV